MLFIHIEDELAYYVRNRREQLLSLLSHNLGPLIFCISHNLLFTLAFLLHSYSVTDPIKCLFTVLYAPCYFGSLEGKFCKCIVKLILFT